MPTIDTPNETAVSRRRLLGVAGSGLGVLGLGSAPVGADSSGHSEEDDTECPKATLESRMVHYDDSIHGTCSDDHPSSEALQAAVKTSLKENYPTVGALIDAGFIPYFDVFTDGRSAHWINPTFIGDDSMLDPDRPESILVDKELWRPIGVMFIATENGEPVDPPPAIHSDEDDHDSGCRPWHAHVGFPGRYSWWKYRKIHQKRTEFPCRTPWMMHVWRYSHQESIYAHGAPEELGDSSPEPPGFDTDADPNEEALSLEHLPDAVRNRV